MPPMVSPCFLTSFILAIIFDAISASGQRTTLLSTVLKSNSWYGFSNVKSPTEDTYPVIAIALNN